MQERSKWIWVITIGMIASEAFKSAIQAYQKSLIFCDISDLQFHYGYSVEYNVRSSSMYMFTCDP